MQEAGRILLLIESHTRIVIDTVIVTSFAAKEPEQ